MREEEADALRAVRDQLAEALFHSSEVMCALRRHVTDETLANLEREIESARAALAGEEIKP